MSLTSIVDLDDLVTFARSVSEFYQQFQGNGKERNQMGGIKKLIENEQMEAAHAA